MAENMVPDEKMAEAAEQAERQFRERGIPVEDTLEALGIAPADYQAYKKRQKRGGVTKTRNSRKGKKVPRYTPETFRPIYEEVEGYRRVGLTIKEAIRKSVSGISEATYYKHLRKLTAQDKEQKKKAAAERLTAKASGTECAGTGPSRDSVRFARLENENKTLRDIVLDRDLEVKHLQMQLRMNGIEPI